MTSWFLTLVLSLFTMVKGQVLWEYHEVWQDKAVKCRTRMERLAGAELRAAAAVIEPKVEAKSAPVVAVAPQPAAVRSSSRTTPFNLFSVRKVEPTDQYVARIDAEVERISLALVDQGLSPCQRARFWIERTALLDEKAQLLKTTRAFPDASLSWDDQLCELDIYLSARAIELEKAVRGNDLVRMATLSHEIVPLWRERSRVEALILERDYEVAREQAEARDHRVMAKQLVAC